VARRKEAAKVITTLRIPRRDMDAVYLLAGREGVSRPQFVCNAVKEEVERAALELVTAELTPPTSRSSGPSSGFSGALRSWSADSLPARICGPRNARRGPRSPRSLRRSGQR